MAVLYIAMLIEHSKNGRRSNLVNSLHEIDELIEELIDSENTLVLNIFSFTRDLAMVHYRLNCPETWHMLGKAITYTLQLVLTFQY